jgi:hypothetical protein
VPASRFVRAPETQGRSRALFVLGDTRGTRRRCAVEARRRREDFPVPSRNIHLEREGRPPDTPARRLATARQLARPPSHSKGVITALAAPERQRRDASAIGAALAAFGLTRTIRGKPILPGRAPSSARADGRACLRRRPAPGDSDAGRATRPLEIAVRRRDTLHPTIAAGCRCSTKMRRRSGERRENPADPRTWP